MNTDKDGGPAFPHWDGPSGQCFNGMSLRAYIATAMQAAMLASADSQPDREFNHTWANRVAEHAVKHADALIAELAKERT